MGTIGKANLVIFKNPACGDSMRISLNMFDLGTLDGVGTATGYMFTMISSCICIDNPYYQCKPEELTDVAKKLNAFPELDAKARRDGVYAITTHLQDSPCTDLPIAVELYKLGYSCGYGVGIASPMLRRTMDHYYAQAFPSHVTELSDSCWAKVSAAAPPAARP